LSFLSVNITQTQIGWDTELLRFALNEGLLSSASEVSMLLWMCGPLLVQNETFTLK